MGEGDFCQAEEFVGSRELRMVYGRDYSIIYTQLCVLALTQLMVKLHPPSLVSLGDMWDAQDSEIQM